MKRLNKLCPRQEDPAVCSALQPSYVRVVPEATWRRIVKVLNEAWALKDSLNFDECPELRGALAVLHRHLGKQNGNR